MIYVILFFEFFKVGLFTFGGGYAMIPLIEELVIGRSWLSQTQFYDFIGVCESTPGPVAINMATYIGSTQGGLLGSIVATAGVVLPSFLIILLVASVLKNFEENKFVKAFLKGVKPVVVALIVSTGVVLLAKAFGYVSLSEFNADFISIIIFALITGIYFAMQKFFKIKLSAVKIILISAALGICISLIGGK
ncbi:MAG: chromate transporter [Clostridia bacterium]|nr:chromate transporter [Clostridia bacterium]